MKNLEQYRFVLEDVVPPESNIRILLLMLETALADQNKEGAQRIENELARLAFNRIKILGYFRAMYATIVYLTDDQGDYKHWINIFSMLGESLSFIDRLHKDVIAFIPSIKGHETSIGVDLIQCRYFKNSWQKQS